MSSDVIATLAGLAPDSALQAIRERKPITVDQAQASYRALFEPTEDGEMSLTERRVVATFVASLHDQAEATAFYATGLPTDLATAVVAEGTRARTTGPYGAYPPGPLSVEDVAGPVYQPGNPALGVRLSAAFAHVHMLVFHPRDANPAGLQALLDTGWSNPGIVTLSQLVAFLAFQLRASAALRVLARVSA